MQTDQAKPISPAYEPIPALQLYRGSSESISRIPELLAPAGDWDCAKAAVENGADAIYFGLEKFNARMRATISLRRTSRS